MKIDKSTIDLVNKCEKEVKDEFEKGKRTLRI